MRFAPGGEVFVAEKSGKVLVYDSLSDPTPALFADLRTEVYNANDRGLLGLALDPQFPTRPYVYLLYAYDAPIGGEAPVWGKPGEDGDPCPEPPGANTDGCVISGRLTRLTAEGDHAKEDGGPPFEEVLANDWCQQFSSHSVGDLQFDSEGNLLVSGGDGASFTTVDYGQFGDPLNPCGDPPAGVGGIEIPPTAEGGALRAQNPKSLDGSLIRVSPDTGGGVPTNPLAGSLDGNERRIVGKGFRNPFRFAIDPATDEIYVDNVGSSRFEEIDRFTPSPSHLFNSGWPCYEGPERREAYELLGLDVCEHLYEDPSLASQPFFYYSHSAGVTPEDPCPYAAGAALTGLAFYEGGAYPAAYDGALFFADSVRGCIYVMRAGEDGRPSPSSVEPFLTEGGLYPGVDIEVGPEGNLYYVSLFGEEYGPGAVHRISYDPDAPRAELEAAGPAWGPTPLAVEFDACESTDPQEEPLEYEWDLDGDGKFAPPVLACTASETYTVAANRPAAVRVADQGGGKSVAQLTVYPGDAPPVPTIEEPVAELEWAVGEQIHFTGSALDGGQLPNSSLYWRSRLYHCPGGPESCHGHPLQVFPAVASGNLIAPDHDLPSHIEITLTATDARGLSASESVTVYPRVASLGIESAPPGITLSAGEETAPAPFPFTAIEGSKVTLSAPQSAALGGQVYTWTGWSDGGPRVHTVVAKGPAAYVATYSRSSGGSGTGEPTVGPPEPRPAKTGLRGHPRRRTHSTTAKFAFSSDQPGARFRCKLDARPFRSCGSPVTFRHLRPGRHLFEVFAVAPGGNADPTPATFSWRVL